MPCTTRAIDELGHVLREAAGERRDEEDARGSTRKTRRGPSRSPSLPEHGQQHGAGERVARRSPSSSARARRARRRWWRARWRRRCGRGRRGTTRRAGRRRGGGGASGESGIASHPNDRVVDATVCASRAASRRGTDPEDPDVMSILPHFMSESNLMGAGISPALLALDSDLLGLELDRPAFDRSRVLVLFDLQDTAAEIARRAAATP